MAVTSVTEIPDAASGGWDHLYRRTYSRGYRVEVNARFENEYTIRTALDTNNVPLLPRIGYPMREYHNWTTGNAVSVSALVDAGSFCVGHSYRRVSGDAANNVSVWEVQVDYGPYESAVLGSDPTQWAIKCTFGGTRVERTVLYDQAGNAIVNSAHDTFKEPLTVDDSRTTLTIVRNELCASFSNTLAETFRDTLNVSPWNGFSSKLVKCGTIATSDPQYDTNNGVWYYSVTYPFEVNRDGWAKKILDQGTGYLDGSGKLRRLTGSDGQTMDEPTLLDGAGHQLAAGGTPVFLTFDVYSAIDWSGLNLNLALKLGN